jgi:hypothetical protein
VDSLPPSLPANGAYVYAPGDIHPRGPREQELCARASHPDWAYLAVLAGLDVAGIWFGSWDKVKFTDSVPLRISGPAAIGLTWGATVGGAWLALPKCSPDWVGEPPPEGDVRANWPLALSLALLAGATAPFINGIAIGSYDLPREWTTEERAMHVVVAGVAAFGGALLPYLIPPRTWTAAREIERIRFGADGHGGMFLGYSSRF